MISVHFQGKPFNIMVIQADTPTSNTEEAEVEWFYDRTNTQERCPFHHRGLECKSGKSRNTGVTGKFGLGVWNERAKANRVFPREHTGHSKYPLPTTQEKILHMDSIRWSTLKSDCLYSLQPKKETLYSQQKQD